MEVGGWRGQWLGGSRRYIAVGLYRGSYRSRGPEKTRRRLWLGGSWRYIAGGLCRGREAEEEEEEEKEEGRREDGRRVEI